MDSYYTLAREGEARYTVQKSLFIGNAVSCLTEEEAQQYLRKIRENTKDASHHCFAYIIGNNEGIMRYSDDGEPGGTAGMPIISVIRAEKIVNCCVVVTRYFGGILLGTGGLVRAYTQTCKLALEASGISRMEWTCHDLCEVPYSFWDRIRYLLEDLPVRIQNISYTSAVSFELLTRQKDHICVLDKLQTATNRQIVVLENGEQYEPWEK